MALTPHDLLTMMMMLSSRFPFRVTSSYRDPESNEQVGGAPNSRHMLWLAYDIVLLHHDDTSEFMIEANRQGLKVLDEGNHLHIQAP